MLAIKQLLTEYPADTSQLKLTIITNTSLQLTMLHQTRISLPQEYVIRVEINVYAQLMYI